MNKKIRMVVLLLFILSFTAAFCLAARGLDAVQMIALAAAFVTGLIYLISFRREAVRARALNRARSSFLIQTNHEIRTSMNAVLGMSELALRDVSPPEAVEYLDKIKQAGGDVLSVIDDILDISKIELGTLEINPAPYSLASVFNDVITIIRAKAAEKSLLFIADMDADIPDKLSGDEGRIRQILLSLLSNGVKYTGKGHIRFTARMDGPVKEKGTVILTFEAEDSGAGIREADLPDLFQSFTRFDGQENSGSARKGLGLAIIKNLCTAMGGDISVKSIYGAGSTFSVRIPQVCLSKEPLASVENPGGKKTLCRVKNNYYAGSIAYTLKGLDVPARFCSSAEEFYRELGEGDYSFAFVDEDEAAEAAALIKKQGLRTALTALTAAAEPAYPLPCPGIQMPLYAVPAANALNSRMIEKMREERKNHFTAPEARILVVDDISTNLMIASGLLASYQCQVDTCSGGKEALLMVQERYYDLVFMDHMMPGMDGIESTRHIRALEGDYYQRLPIIALTANAAAGMREMFLSEGFNDYMSKPIEISNLDDVMETWIPADKKSLKSTGDEKADGEPPGMLDDITIEGLDLAAGKERYGEKTYLEVLRAYSIHTPALLEKLRTLTRDPLRPDTVGDFTITIHGVKGSTAGIRADETAKQAEALEQAARSGDLEYIQAAISRFIGTAETLLRNITALLEKAAGEAAAKPEAPSPDKTLLAELLEACKHYKAGAMEEILTRLESFEYESGGDLIPWLREQADNLEYSAIRQRLETPDQG